ncbi:hypothetical protein BED65_15645 [Listeria monocytogenes]|nr:hypothetical protein [Listeria monocytogenes]
MRRIKLDHPFKVTAVKLVLKEIFSAKEGCTELDINAHMLLSEYKKHGKNAFSGYESTLFNIHCEFENRKKPSTES